jgi:hypothetical protein
MSEHKKPTGRERLAKLIAGSALGASALLAPSMARATWISGVRPTGGKTASGNERTGLEWQGIYTATDEDCALTGARFGGWESLAGDDYTFSESGGQAFEIALEPYLYPATNTTFSNSQSFAYTDKATVARSATLGGSDVIIDKVSGTCSATVNGTKLSGAYTLDFAKDIARVTGTIVVTNDSTEPFTGAVSIYTDFFGDDSTVVEQTSSGDTNFDSRDYWVITSDSDEIGDPNPVVLSFVSSDAYIGPFTDLNDLNDDPNIATATIVWKKNLLALAPGDSVTLTAGHQLFRTVEEAATAARQLRDPSPSVPVATMTNPALLALAGALGLFGSLRLRSRAAKRKR